MDNESRIARLNELTYRSKQCFDILPIGNLTLNEISVLLKIIKGQSAKGSPLNMSEAGEALGLCRSAMSQLVGRLERKGMLKREIVPFDRRRTLIKLTNKAIKIADGIKQKRIDSISRAINIMGSDNVDKFIELYQQYIDAVEDNVNA